MREKLREARTVVVCGLVVVGGVGGRRGCCEDATGWGSASGSEAGVGLGWVDDGGSLSLVMLALGWRVLKGTPFLVSLTGAVVVESCSVGASISAAGVLGSSSFTFSFAVAAFVRVWCSD